MRELLAAAGYAVLEASDGQAGGCWCQEYPIDVVLTDLLMPGQDGFQTIRALRTLRPSLKIIALTGAASMDPRDMLAFAQESGADRTLAKPVRMDDLVVAAIEALLAEP